MSWGTEALQEKLRLAEEKSVGINGYKGADCGGTFTLTASTWSFLLCSRCEDNNMH